ncbi:MAG: class I SAM-dependent methyltransferase [Thermoplasmata archaeon]
MIYIKVKREETERAKEKMFEMNMLDDNYRIFVDDEYGYIPVKNHVDGYEIVESEGVRRQRNQNPYERIRTQFPLREFRDLLPDKWEKLGDIVLLKLPEELIPYKNIVGKTYSDVLNAKSVINYHYVRGELREPVGEIIYGTDSETVHLENGIYYKFDALKIMFSSGNVDERIRVSKFNLLDMRVVDMFAGIGYFSIPIARYTLAERIISIEKNPISHSYLKENIKINNVKNIIPVLGDNREIRIMDWADMVLMGYIHTSGFIEHAVRMLKRKGIIIYHDTFRKEEIRNIEERMDEFFGKYQYSIIRKHILKSYAPSIYHVVFDIFLRKV